MRRLLLSVLFAALCFVPFLSLSATESGTIVLDLASPLNPEKFEFNDKGVWTETYNDNDYTYWESQIFMFSHLAGGPGSSFGGISWDGFTVSRNADDTKQSDWVSNQWGCMAKGGITSVDNGVVSVSSERPYIVGNYSAWTDKCLSIMFNDGNAYTALGVYVSNHPWPYYGNIYGDGYASAMTKDGDYFKLTAHGVDAEGNEKTLDFYLARYKDGELKQSKGWEWFDLSGLGEVEEIYFTMDSSDSGNFGMNTAGYFCMDRFTVKGSSPYSDGLFVVNEDWFGHSNGTINFLNNKGEWQYRVYRKENEGKELGATSQFLAVYGDKVFMVSKQADAGSRLAVADAATMKSLAEIKTIGGKDGRAFVGVDAAKGYVSTSGGIYLFNIADMSLGNLIPQSDGGECTSMIRTADKVFALHASKGILVINPETDAVENTISGSYSGIVQSKDGNVWASMSSSAALLKIDPSTLSKESVSIASTVYSNQWAWTYTALWASVNENVLYWQGSSTKIYKWDLSQGVPTTPIIDITGNANGYTMYGTGFRNNPVNDDIYMLLNKSWSNDNSVWRYSSTGTKLAEYPLETYYWFQAMPAFTDNYAPVVSADFPSEISVDAAGYKLSLKGTATDKDNLSAAIVKSVEGEKSPYFNASIKNDELLITPIANGASQLTVVFNSNGKIVKRNIGVTVASVTGIEDNLADNTVKVYTRGNELHIAGAEGKDAVVYAVNGTVVYEGKITDNTAIINISAYDKGMYIVKVGSYTAKVMK